MEKKTVTFNGYGEYHEVMPSQVADLLKQTKYKDIIESIERGELALQHCRVWANCSDRQEDWDEEVFIEEKGETIEAFFEKVLSRLDEVMPEYSTFGYGSFDWECQGFTENILGNVHVCYPDGNPVLNLNIVE